MLMPLPVRLKTTLPTVAESCVEVEAVVELNSLKGLKEIASGTLCVTGPGSAVSALELRVDRLRLVMMLVGRRLLFSWRCSPSPSARWARRRSRGADHQGGTRSAVGILTRVAARRPRLRVGEARLAPQSFRAVSEFLHAALNDTATNARISSSLGHRWPRCESKRYSREAPSNRSRVAAAGLTLRILLDFARRRGCGILVPP